MEGGLAANGEGIEDTGRFGIEKADDEAENADEGREIGELELDMVFIWDISSEKEPSRADISLAKDLFSSSNEEASLFFRSNSIFKSFSRFSRSRIKSEISLRSDSDVSSASFRRLDSLDARSNSSFSARLSSSTSLCSFISSTDGEDAGNERREVDAEEGIGCDEDEGIKGGEEYNDW